MNSLILLARHSLFTSFATIFLAQDTTDMTAPTAGGGLMGGAFGIVWLILCLVVIIGLWKVFTKAGQPGWMSIIPFLNFFILCKIAGSSRLVAAPDADSTRQFHHLDCAFP